MAQMDGLVTTCSAAAKYMHIPPDVVIPHGIDLSFFEGDDSINLSERYGFKFGIGLFGRVRSQKGVDLLVDAALDVLPKSPDWGVLIVGEITPDQEAFVSGLKDKITNAGLDKRILFLGKQSFDALPLLFRSVDIVCALSKNEGFGLTVLEAGASSKPVVATKAGAWPDILSLSDFGYLIDVGDKLALVESLTDLASNPDVRLEMGIRGRACIEDKYSVQREASELLNYYESVINGSN
jgi:mannosyltransferase